ncbi:hypothetical protein CPC08DRAFT_176126 [Agrocybe pediades]|nr:hypothetical protein CPC08DRAFT_176126 [Agrocybe pediades]
MNHRNVRSQGRDKNAARYVNTGTMMRLACRREALLSSVPLVVLLLLALRSIRTLRGLRLTLDTSSTQRHQRCPRQGQLMRRQSRVATSHSNHLPPPRHVMLSTSDIW